MDADGFVTIRDRMKDMLISGGENIYPAEVENMLLGHPAVGDAAVIGLASPKWGEVPLAVVVVKKGATLDDGRAAGLVQGQARDLQAAEGGGGGGRDPAQPQRQDPQARAARAVQGLGARAGVSRRARHAQRCACRYAARSKAS